MGAPLIGALRVSLSAETAAFEAGMKRAQRTTATAATGISKSLGTIKTGLAAFAGSLSIGLFTSVIKSSLEYAASLGELASTLGLTTRDLQTFRFAAGQVGISQEELESGIQKLTISMGKAQLGAKAQTEAFKAIGISIDQIKGRDTGTVFRLIADKLEQVSDRSKRAAVEVALFGKAGAKLDNLLSGMEGGLSGLSAAAQELGIVLSDEQIQNADQTADKLDAVKTVLQARLAGVVADNATAILDLATAFGELVSSLIQAAAWLGNVGVEMRRLGSIAPGLANILSADLTGALPIAMKAIKYFSGNKASGGSSGEWWKPSARSTGIGQFLAPSGPKAKKGREDHSAEKAAREANQFDQEIRRANIDILNAKKELAVDYVEQTSIAIEIKDSERAAFVANLQYEVASKERTKVQAAQLLAAYDSKDALERTAILDEEQAKRREDVRRLDDLTFELQRDRLESESRLAETAKEQRDVQLRLLDLYYRQERARLEAVLADEKSTDAAKEEARRRLDNLNKTYANDRQGVVNATRTPLQDYMAKYSNIDEENEQAVVNGLEDMADALSKVADGWKAMKEAALSALQSLAQQLLKNEINHLFASLIPSVGGLFGGGGIGGIFGGSGLGSSLYPVSGGIDPLAPLPGYASGGSGIFRGIPGMDRNVISMNGIPQFRVSAGERFSISNDNDRSWRGGVVMNVYTPDADSFRRSEGQTTRALKRRLR